MVLLLTYNFFWEGFFHYSIGLNRWNKLATGFRISERRLCWRIQDTRRISTSSWILLFVCLGLLVVRIKYSRPSTLIYILWSPFILTCSSVHFRLSMIDFSQHWIYKCKPNFNWPETLKIQFVDMHPNSSQKTSLFKPYQATLNIKGRTGSIVKNKQMINIRQVQVDVTYALSYQTET